MAGQNPGSIGYSRLSEQNRPRGLAAALDASAICGTWFNADLGTPCLRSVVVTEAAGELQVDLVAAHGNPGDLPVCVGRGYIDNSGRPQFAALTATGSTGALDIRLEGNLNAGLLVLCCYTRHRDGSHPGCFSREYFTKAASPWSGYEADKNLPADQQLFHGVDLPDVPGTGSLTGRWLNADSGSDGLAELSIGSGGDGLEVQVTARGEIDWGQTTAPTYADVVYGSVGGAAASAHFQFGFAECHLQLRATKGVMVLASHTLFTPEQDRPPEFIREFFHKA
ncbi:MAG: hypothetical protein AAF441_22655 [Pseudomonadota bacterium]